MGLPTVDDAYRTILENLPIGVYLVDRERRIVLWNDGCERLTGYLRHEVVGRCCADELLMHCDEKNEIMCGTACPLLETMHDGRLREADLFLRHKGGQRVPVRVRAVPVRDSDGSIVGACECFDQREVLHLATPGLPLTNKHELVLEASCAADDFSILQRLNADLLEFRSSHIPFGVLCLSVDNLDDLRASDGAHAVSKVLNTSCRTLAQSLGPANWLGRRTDGFVAAVRGCTNSSLLDAAHSLKRLVSLDAVPWWGDRIRITMSAGGTLARMDDQPEDLLRRADEALRRSIGAGQNQALVA